MKRCCKNCDFFSPTEKNPKKGLCLIDVANNVAKIMLGDEIGDSEKELTGEDCNAFTYQGVKIVE